MSECFKDLGIKLDTSCFEIEKELHYFNFLTKVLNKDKIFEKNPKLKQINDVLPFNCALLFLKPFVTYKWHKDSKRGVCINALVSDSNYFTCFSKNYDTPEVQSDIIQLDYKKNNLYLFNNQIYHTVFNFEKERILFSCEFNLNKNKLSYEDAEKIINEKNHCSF